LSIEEFFTSRTLVCLSST